MNYRKDLAPATTFPGSNDFDIPDLLLELQADYIDLPFVSWGRLNRRVLRNAGTVHFYCSDKVLMPLKSHPHLVWGTKAVTLVEPNFSIGDDSPFYWALWQIAWKRHLARLYQSKGLRVIVDLNVPFKYQDLNMMGVPLGWKAFAARGYNGNSPKSLLELYHFAQNWAGTDRILFLVYGGGRDVENMCKREGLTWFPEEMHLYETDKKHLSKDQLLEA